MKNRGYSPDDLVVKKGFGIYDEMQRDAVVKSALEVKKFAVLAKPWRIIPATDSKKDEKIANFVEWSLRHVRGEVTGVLYETLDALAKGFSVGEMVWEISKDEWEGNLILKAVKAKDPSYYDFEVDEYLNIKRLLLSPGGSEATIDLPPEKFLIYSHNGKYSQPWGASDLRSVYKHWWCKDFLIKWWQLFCEKYAMPSLVGYYKTGTPLEKQNQLLTLLSKIASDTAIILPEEISDTIAEIYTARDPRILYESAVNYHDTQISIGILGETLSMQSPGKSSSASYAMASVHQDTLIAQLEKIKQALQALVNERLVTPLVRYNFAGARLPKFVFQPLKEEDISEKVDRIWKLSQVGEVVPGESWIREYLSLPKKEDVPITDSETLDEMKEKLPENKSA
jgi:phage gp29-like protein